MLEELLELESRLTPALRPTYRGALFIFGLAQGWAGKLLMLAVLAVLLLLAGVPAGALLFLEFLGVAVVAGAAAGTLHGRLHRLVSWGQLGTWLRWSATIFAYLLAVALLTPRGPFSLDPTFLRFAAVVSALAAGLLVLLDDRRPARPSERRFQIRQRRERLWSASRRMRARLGGALRGRSSRVRTV
ncbi:MAG TPA: hypothetical protein VL241_12100 [Gemmatimonadales bacterium]|nr:hypothetical protein [Gemmatimonadales bacterium]